MLFESIKEASKLRIWEDSLIEKKDDTIKSVFISRSDIMRDLGKK